MDKKIAGLLAAAAIAGLGFIHPAAAQSSFERSCRHVAQYGDRLEADCRMMDGDWVHAILDHVSSCIGDIGNQNGTLTCNRRDERRHFDNDWGR